VETPYRKRARTPRNPPFRPIIQRAEAILQLPQLFNIRTPEISRRRQHFGRYSMDQSRCYADSGRKAATSFRRSRCAIARRCDASGRRRWSAVGHVDRRLARKQPRHCVYLQSLPNSLLPIQLSICHCGREHPALIEQVLDRRINGAFVCGPVKHPALLAEAFGRDSSTSRSPTAAPNDALRSRPNTSPPSCARSGSLPPSRQAHRSTTRPFCRDKPPGRHA
jgi:hypothetical protein